MRTSEVLNKAADLIETRGWSQGSWGGGASCSAPVCVEGAIAAAMDLSLGALLLTEPRSAEENHAFIQMLDCPAYAAVSSFLAISSGGLYVWNDEHGRTAEQVIEVLRAAALIEQAKEAEVTEQAERITSAAAESVTA